MFGTFCYKIIYIAFYYINTLIIRIILFFFTVDVTHFDVVAIIRGGGGDVGLTCYNKYELAKAIALFPLPVITGIGHSTNETVAEMIAYKNAITPTELADFLIQKFHNFAVPVQKAHETIAGSFARILQAERVKVLNSARYFKSVTLSELAQRKNEAGNKIRALQQHAKYYLQQKRERHIHQNMLLIEKGSMQMFLLKGQFIESAGTNILNKTCNFFHSERQIIAAIEKSVELLNPVNIIKRGYSITLADGKILKTVDEVREGTMLKTILPDGHIISTTKLVNKSENHE